MNFSRHVQTRSIKGIDGRCTEMGGIGKKRSKYGEFIDKHGIHQEKVREVTKLNKDTLTRVCSTEQYPSGATMRKLLDAARKLTGKDVKADDFWTL
jgi:hypothetical protein